MRAREGPRQGARHCDEHHLYAAADEEMTYQTDQFIQQEFDADREQQ